MQQLKALWEQYCVTHHGFNLSVLPEEIKKQGIRITYQPQSVIVSRGTFPEYIYFIESGTALGTRHYDDGTAITILRSTWRPAPSGCWKSWRGSRKSWQPSWQAQK